MMKVFRGSWIPATDKPNCQRFSCPFCGETVYMPSGTPTYPTCPWCISDMPEAEDFDTPEELRAAKMGNKGSTGLTYSTDPTDNATRREKRREWYALNKEHEREYQRNYYYEHRDEINEKARERYQKNKQHRLEYQRRYRAEHHDEILAKARAAREADPERFKAYNIKHKGNSMREVEAHIRGVPVEDIPRNGFYFGKGVQREK